ncbi:MAG: polyketide cyclase [Rikenellaceae bacterium]
MSLQKYTSKQVQILRPASVIYFALSSFNNFTPIIADKVEDWSANDDTCSFKAKGFNVGLKMVERTPNECIKIEGDDSSPMPFTFWLQMKEMAESDTRVRIVLHVELNMMMKMMVGDKLQEAVDTMAEKIAESFNNAPI